MKIPKGWKKLKRGTVLKEGDHLLSRYSKKHDQTVYIGEMVGCSHSTRCTYIRRIKRKPSPKPRKRRG